MKIELKDSYLSLIKAAGVIAAAIACIFIAYKLCFYLGPFIIAFCLSMMIEPLIRLMMRRLSIKRKVAAPAAITIIISVLGFFLFWLVSTLIDEIIGISSTLPQFFSELYKNLQDLMSKASDWLPPEIPNDVASLITSLSSSLTGLTNTIVKNALHTAAYFPELLIFIMTTLISTYFLSCDRDRIYSFFYRRLPASWLERYTSLKNDMFSALFGYIKAQLILMSITFAVLFISFLMIKIRYALLFALLIALIDALPVLGTGTVMVPWGLYAILTGNENTGISILIIFAVVLIIRQMIEPKILGHQIGVHPLVTLIAMYAGLKLLGFAGLILGPVAVILLKNILSGIWGNAGNSPRVVPPRK